MTKPPIHLESRKNNGARLYSPSAERNKEPIAEVLEKHLSPDARVLEIASGTGEHAVYVCARRPDIWWQPSDPDAASRASQDAWATEVVSDQMSPSLDINTMDELWTENLGPYDAIYCANMIHIAPWEAALGLASGAKILLNPDGKLFLYGPFLEGEGTAASNLSFDENLKTRDSRWGVRDLELVKHIFADAGLEFETRIVMPKENRLLIFSNSSFHG